MQQDGAGRERLLNLAGGERLGVVELRVFGAFFLEGELEFVVAGFGVLELGPECLQPGLG